MSERDPSLPTPEQLRIIAQKQDEKERSIKLAREQASSDDRRDAAEKIQKYYRGYRTRRMLRGCELTPSQRWVAAVKDAEYQNVTRPLPRDQQRNGDNVGRTKWRQARAVAERARGHGVSDSSESDSEHTAPTAEDVRSHKHGAESNRKRAISPRSMGLEYFLEMVDHKHRYGSNLRAYHKSWQDSGTTENFFYWLDYGEGKSVDLENRPRKRLDGERVRYLSKEERKKYRVMVDEEGLLCWAKNGERINTGPDYRDSMEGIVPVSDDRTPTWQACIGQESDDTFRNDPESSASTDSDSSEDAAKYTNQDLHDAKGLSKVKHLSAGAIHNSLLRKTTKKNTWIFIADTSFRLYLGIKQSGYFQHSSLSAGGRIAAAGTIRIKRGQIRRISPLSGHYSPPMEAFRGLVANLKEAGVDLSRMSVSRSYLVLTGLEGYLGVKNGLQKGGQQVKDMLNPEEAKSRAEKQMDHSESARKERDFLQATAEKEAQQRRKKSLSAKMMEKLKINNEEEESEN